MRATGALTRSLRALVPPAPAGSRWALPAALLLVVAFVLMPRPPHAQASVVPVTPSAWQERDIEHQLERFALNALLVPLLDDTEHPPRWSDPAASMGCAEVSRVGIDGHPLDPGTEMSGRGFSVQWHLDDCVPFGVEGPALSGLAELEVFRENEGLSAIVRLLDLRVQRDGLIVVMNKTFVARTP
jgi:hypothetical protein